MIETMTPTRAASLPRWVPTLVTAALVVAIAVFGAAPASAATTRGAQNGVGASTSAGQVAVGLLASITTGQRLGDDPSQPQIVVATDVAAETADSAVDVAARRVTLRVGTKAQIRDAAPRTATGEFIDPSTGTVIPKSAVPVWAGRSEWRRCIHGEHNCPRAESHTRLPSKRGLPRRPFRSV
jgi:hypothetical protein